MSSFYPSDNFDYQLIDTGAFQKLEQFGPHRFCRPAPQAIWPKSLPASEWKKAEGEYKYFNFFCLITSEWYVIIDFLFTLENKCSMSA